MTRWYVAPLGLLLTVAAGPVQAQQWQVARDQFAFAGRQLSVFVESEAEGTLRVIRGAPGVVRISGSADTGMTAAGLTGTRDLTLTGVGYGPVDFVISVPERVRVQVHLPDRTIIESMGGQDRSRSFQWGPAPSHETYPPAAVAGLLAPDRDFLPASAFTVYAADLAPAVVALPDLAHVRAVTVRVEDSRFRVGASRPLALRPGDSDRMEIRPAGPPMDVILIVPAGTRSFTLEADGQVALTLEGDRIDVHCSPSTRQWLDGGRGWVTFTPADGALRCAVGQTRGTAVE